MVLECDILVVGGGPAGLSAARAAAKNGAKVICIEKKKQIGMPVQCAEGIGLELLHNLPFKIPRNLLEWKIDGFRFYLNDWSVKSTGTMNEGFSITRWKVEQWLAKAVEQNGGKVVSNSDLFDLEIKGGKVVGQFTHANRKKTIFARKVICADGVYSKSAKLLGVYKPKKNSLGPIYSWEFAKVKVAEPHLESLFLGSFAPTGYGYIFPKSRERVNVGVGTIIPKKKCITYFEEFLELPIVKQQLKHSQKVVEKTKDAAFGKLINKWTMEQILFVGDIATHNYKPFVEGFVPSMIAGNFAGNFSVTHSIFLEEEYRKGIFSVLPFLSDSEQLLELMLKIFKQKQSTQELLLFALSSELLNPKYIQKSLSLDSSTMERKIKRRLAILLKLN